MTCIEMLCSLALQLSTAKQVSTLSHDVFTCAQQVASSHAGRPPPHTIGASRVVLPDDGQVMLAAAQVCKAQTATVSTLVHTLAGHLGLATEYEFQANAALLMCVTHFLNGIVSQVVVPCRLQLKVSGNKALRFPT